MGLLPRRPCRRPTAKELIVWIRAIWTVCALSAIAYGFYCLMAHVYKNNLTHDDFFLVLLFVQSLLTAFAIGGVLTRKCFLLLINTVIMFVLCIFYCWMTWKERWFECTERAVTEEGVKNTLYTFTIDQPTLFLAFNASLCGLGMFISEKQFRYLYKVQKREELEEKEKECSEVHRPMYDGSGGWNTA